MNDKLYNRVAKNCSRYQSRFYNLKSGLVKEEPSCLDCEHFVIDHCKLGLYDAILNNMF